MSSTTSFLSLTLPENGEYVDAWNQPLNANFEELDDHLSGLHDDLVEVTGATTNLKGSTASLQARLDAGLNTDGTIKLSTSTQFSNLKVSAVYAVSSKSDAGDKIRDRLDYGDVETAGLRFNTHADRFGGSGDEEAATGIALLAGKHAGVLTEAIQSPVRGFTPDAVVDGPATLATTTAAMIPTHLNIAGSTVTVNASSSQSVVYNVGGLPMSFRELITLSVTGSPTGTIWFWASKADDDYNSSSSEQWTYTAHKASLSGSFMLDPRVLPTHSSLRSNAITAEDPTDGSVVAGASTLSTSSGGLQTYGAEAGDFVVVSSPSALAGSYLVDSVSSDTELSIKGEWTETNAAVTFHVERRTIPSFGFMVGDDPTYKEGRLYIGKATVTAGDLSDLIPFAYNGVYDSGWQQFNSRFAAAPSFANLAYLNHYLGVTPTEVTVMVKDSTAVSPLTWVNPTIPIAIQHTDEKDGTSWTTSTDTFVPAFSNIATRDTYKAIPTNPLRNTYGYAQIFYDDSTDGYVGSTSTTYFVRVILRR